MKKRTLLMAALCLLELAGCGGGNASNQVNVAQQVKLSHIVGARYTLTPLPGIDGTNALNNDGQIVGFSNPLPDGPPGPSYVYVVQNGMEEVLSTDFRPEAINDAGTIVGISDQGIPLLLQNNHLIPIAGMPSGSAPRISAINNNGAILVSSFQGVTDLIAYLWVNGKATKLPTISGQQAMPNDLNDAGVAVGECHANVNIPVIWQNGAITALPVLPVSSSPYLGGAATAINNAGQIVGQSYQPFGQGNIGSTPRAVLWQNGQITDLQNLLSNAQSSTANSINNKGQIVGNYHSPNGDSCFLYSNGTMIDLNTLLPQGSGWTLSGATKINDRGEILVLGNHGAALLSPNGL